MFVWRQRLLYPGLVASLGLLLSTQGLAQQDRHGDPADQQGGHNERFLDPELDVDQFSNVFESESREVFAARDEITSAMGLDAGMTVADIGCHSLGFMPPYEVGTVLLCMGHAVSTGSGVFKAVRARARGYRNLESFMTMIYLIGAPLDFLFNST